MTYNDLSPENLSLDHLGMTWTGDYIEIEFSLFTITKVLTFNSIWGCARTLAYFDTIEDVHYPSLSEMILLLLLAQGWPPHWSIVAHIGDLQNELSGNNSMMVSLL